MKRIKEILLLLSILSLVFYCPITHVFVLLALVFAIIERVSVKPRPKLSKTFLLLVAASSAYWLSYVLEGVFRGYTPDLLFSIEVKSTLVYFPIAFALTPLSSWFRKLVLPLFLAALFVKIPISLFHALSNAEIYTFRSFSYISLTYDGHPSFTSFYYVVGFGLLLLKFVEEKKDYNLGNFLIHVLGLLVLTTYILLLSSKAGVISLGVVCVFFIIKAIYQASIRKRLLQILGIVIIATTISVYSFPELVSRFVGIEKVVTKTEQVLEREDSNASRLKLWSASLDLWKSNPLFGVGDERIDWKIYDQIRASGHHISKPHSSHNQLLHELAAHGIVGGIVFIAMMLSFFYVVSFDKWISILLMALFAVQYGVECMLNWQAGVVTFGIFMGMALVFRKKDTYD